MMIDPHTAETSLSPRSSRSTPIRLASSTLTAWRPELDGGLPQRRRRHDDPHDAHQPLGGQLPCAGAAFVFRYIATYDAAQRLEMVDVAWLARQFDGGQSSASSTSASAMASLVAKYRLNVRGETSAIAAIWSTVVLLESLSLAQLDGGVDQRGAGALFLSFTQTEDRLPPYFSHDGMLAPPSAMN